jgi:hypothetical protein
MREVLILGGYGNFGRRIARALLKHGVPIIIAGRNLAKAQRLAMTLREALPHAVVRAVRVDADQPLDAPLTRLNPGVVVNTCGPFQGKDYRVAEACIRGRVHYLDLADARSFVPGIATLDAKARAASVSVISGASTVPGLSSAVIEHYRSAFFEISSLKFGISPGQKAERGLATTEGILSYVGRPLAPVSGDVVPRYGWQDVYRQTYPDLGGRWMANCDVPDLDLFPERYGIKTIQFSAGMESAALHFGLWLLGWGIRLGLPFRPERHAPTLLQASHLFDWLGSDAGGMHVLMKGTDTSGKPKVIRWFIEAQRGDGPQIPCVPAIILARKLAAASLVPIGAMACVGLVSLPEYLEELTGFAISTFEH